MEKQRSEATAIEPTSSTLRASYELATTPGFIARVRAAAVKSAIAVAAEPPETPNHSRRAQLATQVLMSPRSWSEIMAEGVAANPAIIDTAMRQAEIPDLDIESTVTSLWDAYAGLEGARV